MDFEWDEAKRLANISKHRLDFADADLVFDGETVQAPATAKDGEIRVMVTGVLEARYVSVICTFRGDVCRIISFRRARDGEKKRYKALYDG